jgi:hypothetical protein
MFFKAFLSLLFLWAGSERKRLLFIYTHQNFWE